MIAVVQFESAVHDLARAVHRVEELARQNAGRGRRPEPPLKLTPEQIAIADRILRAVADEFGTAPRLICSLSREQPWAFYRQIGMSLIHYRGGLTLGQTARFFGRNLSAVKHGLRAVAARRDTEKAIASALGKIESKIKSSNATALTPSGAPNALLAFSGIAQPQMNTDGHRYLGRRGAPSLPKKKGKVW